MTTFMSGRSHCIKKFDKLPAQPRGRQAPATQTKQTSPFLPEQKLFDSHDSRVRLFPAQQFEQLRDLRTI
jgi:hypothetical protein